MAVDFSSAETGIGVESSRRIHQTLTEDSRGRWKKGSKRGGSPVQAGESLVWCFCFGTYVSGLRGRGMGEVWADWAVD